ncbi:MAG: glycosyltransferase [Anaerolineae bacterium]
MKRVIVLDYFPWEGAIHVGNHAYITRLLQDGAKVLYISMPYNLWRILRKRFDDQDLYHNWKSGPRKVVENLWSFTPLALLPYVDLFPFNSTWVGKNFHHFTIPNFMGTVRKLGFEKPDLVWLANIRMGGLVDYLNPKKVVFRLSDNPWAFSGEPASSKVFFEDVIRSHTTIATAYKLFQEASRFSENVYYIPNGYEPETILSGYHLPEPEDMADIPHPRAVYVGVISHWFDLEMLCQAATLRTDWHFILVGPAQENFLDMTVFHKLCSFPNVYYLGMKRKEMVGAYLRYCDVGIIPFVKDELTETINPIKLYEYAACGLSIVSRNLDEVRRISENVELYDDIVGFGRGLDQALHKRDADAQQQWASQRTWDARYTQVKNILGW